MKKHIVVYGDSNTHGYCADPTDSEDGGDRYTENERYTCLLQNMLGDGFVVYEEGMNGRTAALDDPTIEDANGLTAIIPTLKCHEPVDLLIVMLGTNDTKDCFAQHAKGIAYGLRRLLKKAKDQECWTGKKPEILFVCPPVIPEEVKTGAVRQILGDGCCARSAELAPYMEQFTKELGIDFMNADGCELNTLDYLHLTKKGHRQLAERLYARLAEKFGLQKKPIGRLGFGMMRLPKNGEQIDIEKTKLLVDRFMEAGFNYFDTALRYAGSEEAVREALVKRYPRESYYLTDKNSCWINTKDAEAARRQLEESLENTQAGYFDYYLLHNIGEHRTESFDRFGMWDWIKEMKKTGKIRHWGYSFHDSPELLRDLIEKHGKPDVVQLQINYADWEHPVYRAAELYKICRDNDIPVIIMEPVRGGILADPPAAVREVLEKAAPERSMAAWALRFAGSLEGVLTVLSGMNTPEQMEENCRLFKNMEPLSEAERGTIRQAQDVLAAVELIPCTGCEYCMRVCPNNIGIPGTMTLMNTFRLYGTEAAKGGIGWQIGMHHVKPPDQCVRCGACEDACPQKLKIREILAEATEKLF